MSIEVKVPVLPESVADATVAAWHKQPGDTVQRDENLVDIETDKVVLEVVATTDGVLESITKDVGATVLAQEVIGVVKAGAVAAKAEAPSSTEASAPAASGGDDATYSPAVRKLLHEHGVDGSQITGTGKGGRLTKQDVEKFVTSGGAAAKPAAAPAPQAAPVALNLEGRTEKRVPMTRLRARIAERLVESQQTAAILTTFNEINMKPIMDLRAKYKDKFEKSHGVRLGFMSFFVKAAVEALKRYPLVNASIDGNDIVYHNYFDIGVAVSSDRGLVVPVLRDTDSMSMAGVEKQIRDYGARAQNGQLGIEEMTGGTFTISNGGVFGSLVSTPIINPPQSGILGMHKIEQRPVVEDGEIVVRPMMYVALSYDHRIIDGSQSVGFLVTIKDMIEDPSRLLLEI